MNCSLVTKFLPAVAAVLVLVPLAGCCSKQSVSSEAVSVAETVPPAAADSTYTASVDTADTAGSAQAGVKFSFTVTAGTDSTATVELTGRPVSVNYSALGPANHGEELIVTGELLQSGSSFCIEMNAQSRSKVTFVIDSPAESDQAAGLVAWRKLTQLTGKTVTVTGILTDCSATWTKHMALVSVVAE